MTISGSNVTVGPWAVCCYLTGGGWWLLQQMLVRVQNPVHRLLLSRDKDSIRDRDRVRETERQRKRDRERMDSDIIEEGFNKGLTRVM